MSKRSAPERPDREPSWLEQVLDRSALAVFVIDAGSGRVRYANPAAAELLDCDADDLLGARAWDLDPRLDGPEAWRDRVERLADGELARLAGHLRRRDASPVPVEIDLQRVDVEGEDLVVALVGTVQDERELGPELHRLAAIVENSDDAILAKTLEGTITDWNPAAERLYGYTAQEAIGEHVSLIVPDDKLDELDCFMESVRSGEPVDHHETQRVTKDGRRLDVSVTISPIRGRDGALVGASAIARDVTERKRRETQLRRLAEIVESSHDAIVVRDLDGTITHWNRAAERLYGYTADEAIGRPFDVVVPPEAAEQAESLVDVARRGGAVEDVETVRATKTGDRVEVSLTLWPLRDVDDRVDAVVEIARDVTERKEAQRELRRRNAALERLAYVASHDLKEPLRMVTSYVQLLERRYGNRLDQDARDFIGFAVEGVDRMRTLIDDLLDYSRLGGVEPEFRETDLDEVVETVLERLGPRIANAGARVEVGDLPTLVADPDQLEQLFENLVSNAIKFNETEPPRVSITAEASHAGWTFEVRDNGIGFAPEHREKVFGLFERLEDRGRYPGTGIGLTICKRVVEQHGGDIWIESVEGEGTTVGFTLPSQPSQVRRERDRAAGPVEDVRVEAGP